MNNTNKITSLVASLSVAIVLGCGAAGDGTPAPDESPNMSKSTLTLSFVGLEELGSDYVYEGWLITADGPVTAGRFESPAGYTTEVDTETAASATTYVLTIEPKEDDAPAPSSTHVVAGDINGGAASLSTEHQAALATNFDQAVGSFILETPSSTDSDDYAQGVWFLDPTMGPSSSLKLPTLPAGWVYEGWVVVDGKPASTGRFTMSDEADLDGAGPTAGPKGAPPFAGQDYIDPALNLIQGKVVVTVEPEPDNSAAPFALKPLIGDVMDLGAGTLQPLTNQALSIAITGTLSLQ
jgi:hypothetical protein